MGEAKVPGIPDEVVEVFVKAADSLDVAYGSENDMVRAGLQAVFRLIAPDGLTTVAEAVAAERARIAERLLVLERDSAERLASARSLYDEASTSEGRAMNLLAQTEHAAERAAYACCRREVGA